MQDIEYTEWIAYFLDELDGCDSGNRFVCRKAWRGSRRFELFDGRGRAHFRIKNLRINSLDILHVALLLSSVKVREFQNIFVHKLGTGNFGRILDVDVRMDENEGKGDKHS